MSAQIIVRVPEKMVPLLTKRKRLKVAVGGRGGAKSISVADWFLKCCSDGERLLCAREFQNSIDESVHALLKSRIHALGVTDVHASKSDITSDRGGEIHYKGLARNINSIRSMFGYKKAWIEEGQTLSEETLDVLLPSIREGESEIVITMNRGSSADPISKLVLARHEKELARTGYYEDDDLLIVQINWNDNPWFPEVLNRQRLKALEEMDRAKYDHIWGGAYADSVENAIIEPAWFDACVNAHGRLGWSPTGIEVVSHDPSDLGPDSKALAYRHGMVFKAVESRAFGNVNEGCDWATSFANKVKADTFIWDIDGLGSGLRRQVEQALAGKKCSLMTFSGAMTADNPDALYEPVDGDLGKPKANRQAFYNKRAQYYADLRDRCFKTYLAVEKGKYTNPDELISFAPDIAEIAGLRAEMCRVPKKENGTGKFQVMSKAEMRAKKIDSPNMADAVMMALAARVEKATEYVYNPDAFMTEHA